MKLKNVIRGAGALALMSLAVPTFATIELSFGLYTSNKPTAMVKQFRPVLDALETRMRENLGEPVKIRIQVAKNYGKGVQHLTSGKVDFSRFGPASYVEAKGVNEGLKILAMERQDGDKVFYGIIAVAEDAPIQTVEDLRGKSFAFGSDQSTIGRYLSQLFLRNNGLHAEDFSRYDYLERHDRVGTAVGAGHFDAGALNESTFKKLVAKGVKIRELARFPNVTKPWIARSGLPKRVFKALQNALLELDDEQALKALKKDGFMMGDDADYYAIRTAIEKNGVFFEPNPNADLIAKTAAGDEGMDLAASTDAAATDVPGAPAPAAVSAADEVKAPSPSEASMDHGPVQVVEPGNIESVEPQGVTVADYLRRIRGESPTSPVVDEGQRNDEDAVAPLTGDLPVTPSADASNLVVNPLQRI